MIWWLLLLALIVWIVIVHHNRLHRRFERFEAASLKWHMTAWDRMDALEQPAEDRVLRFENRFAGDRSPGFYPYGASVDAMAQNRRPNQ